MLTSDCSGFIPRWAVGAFGAGIEGRDLECGERFDVNVEVAGVGPGKEPLWAQTLPNAITSKTIALAIECSISGTPPRPETRGLFGTAPPLVVPGNLLAVRFRLPALGCASIIRVAVGYVLAFTASV